MAMMMTTMAMNIMMMPARTNSTTIFHCDHLLKMFLTKANIRCDQVEVEKLIADDDDEYNNDDKL